MERSSSAHHQEHKTVNTASGIVKSILLSAAIVDEMERIQNNRQNYSSIYILIFKFLNSKLEDKGLCAE
jgi:hypothetical protein